MILMISSSCETAREQADAGDQEPRLGAGDGSLEVLCEPAVAPEPREGPFDHPTTGLCPEGSDALRSRDDLDRPFSKLGNRAEQFVAPIDTISKDVPKLGERSADRFEQRHSSVIVLNVGAVHEHRQERAC